MTDQLRAAQLLTKRLIIDKMPTARKELKQVLEDNDLPCTDSFITRLLLKLQDFDLYLDYNHKKKQYEIDPDIPPNLEKIRLLGYFDFMTLWADLYKDFNRFTDYFSLDNQVYNEGLQHFRPLIDAILKGRKVELTYQTFYQAKPKVYVVQPHFLRLFQNRWYLITDHLPADHHPIFAFDRMKTVAVLNENFTRNPQVDKSIFDSVYGVATNMPVVEVVLKFNPWQANYIRTLEIHSSQKVLVEDETGLTISLQLAENFELEQLIKSYGSSVEVLAPESLRAKILNDLKATLAHYEK